MYALHTVKAIRIDDDNVNVQIERDLHATVYRARFLKILNMDPEIGAAVLQANVGSLQLPPNKTWNVFY